MLGDRFSRSTQQILRKELNKEFLRSLRPVALGLGGLFGLLGVLSRLFLTYPGVEYVAASNLISAAIYAGIWWAVRSRRIAGEYAYWIGFGMVLVALGNSLLLLSLNPRAAHLTDLTILMIGSGFFFLSTPWFSALLVLVWGSWLGMVPRFDTQISVVGYLIPLITRSVVAFLIHGIRLHTLSRLILSRERQGRQKKKIRRALEDLHRTDKRFRRLSEATFEGILILRDGKIIDVNRQLETMLGYELQEVRGKTITEFVDPEIVRRIREPDSSESTQPVEMEVNGRDNRVLTVEISTRAFRAGDQTVRIVAIRDISQQIRQHAELRQLYRAIEHSSSVVMMMDTEGSIEYVNPRIRELTGYAPEELIGKNPRVLHVGRPSGEMFQKFREAIANRLAWQGEFLNEKKTGAFYWESVSINPVRTRDGELTGYLAIRDDITELKETQRQLRRAKETAEEASKAKSELLANMSHELRTPLNSVIGFSNILLKNERRSLTGRELDFVRRIKKNGTHLLHLINDMLDLSKIEASRMELQVTEVDLRDLIQDTLEQFKEASADGTVQLQAALPGHRQVASTDADKVKRVLINLIGNALKFTEAGSVTVRLSVNESGRPDRIDVTDTGIGIPKNELAKIFRAFEQVESGPGRKYEGSGLGLAISQALCNLLGYDLSVESTVGKGTTFSIHLDGSPPGTNGQAPRGRAYQAGTDREDASAPGTAGRDQTVLVIDEDLDSRIMLSHQLEKFGLQATTASTGEQGLRIARYLAPDLIVVDIRLSDMDGLEYLGRLREQAELEHTPFLVTGMVPEEGRGVLYGPLDTLDKPFSMEELHQTVFRHLAGAVHRVLVVDDEPDVRDILRQQLELKGYEVREAGDGQEALKRFNTFTPDLILLDIVMPVMDGLVFLERLRTKPGYAHIPVVVITGKQLSGDHVLALHEQTVSIVRKDANFTAALQKMLEAVLDGDHGTHR